MSKPSSLPPSLAPRGLSREQAAEYIGMSTTAFDRLVQDGLMPKPKRIFARVVWDIRQVDAAFSALDSADPGDANPFAGVKL